MKEDEKVRFTEGRLRVEPSKQLKDYVTNVVLWQDLQTFDEYLQVDLAHGTMLIEESIIPENEGAEILKVLSKIRELGVENFPRDLKYDSLIGQLEANLFSEVGKEVGGKLHTGRSRIDMNMAIQLLYTRNRLLDIMKTLGDLQNVILQLAEEHIETVMPGYTHLQHAQPWTFGHYILGYFYQFDRSFDRLKGAFSRTNLNPLGTAALTGSSWPLNRERTRELLGFDGLMEHSKDAGAFTPDFILEVIAHCSIIMWQLSLLFSDLYIWTTHEFDMVSPDPSYCGTSSIMPQKKNPYSIEAILSAAGLAIGWLPAALGALRMMSSTAAFWAYGGRRLHIFEIFQTLRESLELSNGTLQTLDLNKEKMEQRAGAFWSTATELADTIAREKQLAFRVAHQIVGRLVSQSVQDGINPSDVTAIEVDTAAKEITGKALGLSDDTIKEALDPMTLIKKRATVGSVSPGESRKMVSACKKKIAEQEAWLEGTFDRIRKAETELIEATQKIIGKN